MRARRHQSERCCQVTKTICYSPVVLGGFGVGIKGRLAACSDSFTALGRVGINGLLPEFSVLLIFLPELKSELDVGFMGVLI